LFVYQELIAVNKGYLPPKLYCVSTVTNQVFSLLGNGCSCLLLFKQICYLHLNKLELILLTTYFSNNF